MTVPKFLLHDYRTKIAGRPIAPLPGRTPPLDIGGSKAGEWLAVSFQALFRRGFRRWPPPMPSDTPRKWSAISAASIPTPPARSIFIRRWSCWWPRSCRPSVPTSGSTRSPRRCFASTPRAADYARAPLAELEHDIQSTGFFRNKAKNIQAACRVLVERYRGQVPADDRVAGGAARHGTEDGQRGPRHGLWNRLGNRGGHSRRAGQPPPGPDAGKGPRQDRAGPDGVDSPPGVGGLQPPHDPARPALVHGAETRSATAARCGPSRRRSA